MFDMYLEIAQILRQNYGNVNTDAVEQIVDLFREELDEDYFPKFEEM